MEARWALVGRDDHLRRLVGLLATNSPGAVLAGPAGVGKTRLATEFNELTARQGHPGAQATGTRSARALPFGALAHLLPESHGFAGDRAGLLRHYVAALAGRAGDARLVLLVDDAHLLDDASATLVHQLAITRSAFVLVTVRSGEPAPDPVLALWRDDVVERVEVAELDHASIEELLRTALGGPIDADAITQLAARSAGNVMYLRELTLGAVRDGSLTREDDTWTLGAPLRPSDRLVELVESRLALLPEASRMLLEVISFGEPLGPGELDTLAEPGLLEQLEHEGLITSERVGRRIRIQLAHPLYGDVLRGQVSALRARTVARALAGAVESTGARRREDTLRVATWQLEGGGGSPGLLSAAASTARWSYDFALAERLARAAVHAGAGFEAALLLAQVIILQGRGVEVESDLRELTARATTDAQRGSVALIRLDYAAIHQGDPAEGLRLAAEAEASLRDPEWRNEIAARRSGLALIEHGPRAAARVAVPLVSTARDSALVWACIIAARSQNRLGRIAAALEASEIGEAAHATLSVPIDWYPWVHTYTRSESLANLGRLEEATELAQDQLRRGVSDNSPEARAYFAKRLASMVGERGEVQSSIGHARTAATLFRRLGRPHLMRQCLVSLGLAYAMGGQAPESRTALSAIQSLTSPGPFDGTVELLHTWAWSHAAAGDLRAAGQVLDEAARTGEALGDLVGAAVALHALARLGQPIEALTRLADLASEIDGDLIECRVTHTRALATKDGAALEDVSRRFAAMGAHLLAAEAAADAALAWRHASAARRSTAAQRQATQLMVRCPGASTPALRGIERHRLTRAQFEAATLAARGLTNKEIAARLTLSVRTVETHLQRAYEALGVSGRRELEAALSGGSSSP